MEAALLKMDGDVEKLASICGSTYLSDKAKALVEERWKKISVARPYSSLHASKNDDRTRRRSQIPSTRTVGRTDAPEPNNASPSPKSMKVVHYSSGSASLRDELPSLNLRLNERGSSFAMEPAEATTQSMGPFAFSFDPRHHSLRHYESVDSSFDATAGAPYANVLPGASLDALPSKNSDPSSSHTDGAAASLRARLLKIRENKRESKVEWRPALSTSSFPPALSPPDSPLTEPGVANKSSVVRDQVDDSGEVSGNPYPNFRASLEELLHTKMPVPEADPRHVSCTDALKKYHAAISNQPTAAPDLSYTEFSALRQGISDNTIGTVECLTR
jgi:hypothetical protein